MFQIISVNYMNKLALTDFLATEELQVNF